MARARSKRLLAGLLLSGLAIGAALSASVSDASPSAGTRGHLRSSARLSDKDHHQHEDRGAEPADYDYDHEAFLGGAEEAHEFDNLDPEESKRRLGLIVDKIDANADGYVTLEEMRNWIRFSHDRHTDEDVERQWTQHNHIGKDAIGWEDYRKMVYGFLEEDARDGAVPKDDDVVYQRMESRDRRRWQVADEDGDGSLNKYEFRNFLHPEEADHMRDIVVRETMDDIDKDGDGSVSLDEYIGDMYHNQEGFEPDWVKREREQFSEARDLDGDGKMDQEEVKAWIMPDGFDHVEAEARHLIFESDRDDDERLTKEEILAKYDLFVGSQATDFGEALMRHDEF